MPSMVVSVWAVLEWAVTSIQSVVLVVYGVQAVVVAVAVVLRTCSVMGVMGARTTNPVNQARRVVVPGAELLLQVFLVGLVWPRLAN